jgi:hypothetical protein
MSLKDKTIVVTGGSRGLGLGLVEALVDQGAKVTVVARDQAALTAVKQRIGVVTISADVTDETAAHRILAEVRPDILVLNAGATPRMGRLDLGDRRQGRALLAAGGAQSAAQAGKPRPRRIERRGRERISDVRRLCRRQAHALVHGQICEWGLRAEEAGHPLPGDRAAADHRRDRGVGDAGANAYARALGVEREAYLARFGAPLPPRKFGDHLVAVLDDPQYAAGIVFGLKGDTGITVLEGEAA